MGVDLQSGGFFIDRRVARKLRANLDGNLQENALCAARFGACAGTFLIFSGHCHSSLAATFIL
jgi:hypothetical protein